MKSDNLSKIATILLVEDNRMDVELTLDAFGQTRLRSNIHVAKTGAEALDYLFGKGDYFDRMKYPIPDMILLGVKLAVVDGQEVLLRLKAASAFKRIPVIMLTSSQEEIDKERLYGSGANRFLAKPVSFDGFMKVTQQIINYWLTLNFEPPMEQG